MYDLNIYSGVSNAIVEEEEYFFKNNVFPNSVEENCCGMKIGTVISVKDNFNVEVKIYDLDITVIAPLFYVNSLNVQSGDTILVNVENLFSFKALALHSKTLDYKNDNRNVVRLSNGTNDIIIGDDGVRISLDNGVTDFNFKKTGVTVSAKNPLKVTIGNNMRVYFRELDFQGNTFDVVTGSLVSIFKPTILMNDGISFRSFIGSIDISAMIGNVNVSSGTYTNIGSLIMTNVISTGLVNITAQLIPNLTIGFFAPLLPSPAGIVGYKSLFQNLASPIKAPLPVFADDLMKKLRDLIPF